MPIFGKGAEGPLPPRRSAAIVYPPRGGGRSYYVVLCRTVLVLYDTLYDTVRRVVHPRRVGPRRLVRHCTTRRTLPTRRAPTPCTTPRRVVQCISDSTPKIPPPQSDQTRDQGAGTSRARCGRWTASPAAGRMSTGARPCGRSTVWPTPTSSRTSRSSRGPWEPTTL